MEAKQHGARLSVCGVRFSRIRPCGGRWWCDRDFEGVFVQQDKR